MDPDTNSAAAATAAGAGLIFLAVFAIIGIISLVCWIKVLIALFKKEGAGLGILGIFCNIYAFIWGWMKSTELGLKKTMIWWTISIVAAIGVWFVAMAGAVGMAANSPEFKKAIEDAQRKAQEQQAQQAQPATTN
jgi:hypothetical protein